MAESCRIISDNKAFEMGAILNRVFQIARVSAYLSKHGEGNFSRSVERAKTSLASEA